MTVTIINDASSGRAASALYLKQAEVTAHAAAALVSGPQQADAAGRLLASQRELVSSALASGRLDAATCISTCSIPTTNFPGIASLGTLLTNNALLSAGDIGTQLLAERIRCVESWMDSGNGAATILSSLT